HGMARLPAAISSAGPPCFRQWRTQDQPIFPLGACWQSGQCEEASPESAWSMACWIQHPSSREPWAIGATGATVATASPMNNPYPMGDLLIHSNKEALSCLAPFLL